MKLTSNIPHLLAAYYDWIVENDLTPHLRIKMREGNGIPQQHPMIRDGEIIINIHPNAVRDLAFDQSGARLKTRFSGKDCHLQISLQDIMLIFAKEVSIGFAFEMGEDGPETPEPQPPRPTSGKSHLKLVG